MIRDLEQALGYRFRNITLLQNALTHSSYANERWRDSLASNERLEFLGDSILGMITAEHLYRTFPNRPEGELSRIRADLVCETNLAKVAGSFIWGPISSWATGRSRGAAAPGRASWPMQWSPCWQLPIWTGGFLPPPVWFTGLS